MLGNMSTLVFVLCLAASVAGSAMLRIERSAGDTKIPIFNCGQPTNHILNGGIKLFPRDDFHDPHDHSCELPNLHLCEYKFYCEDGYNVKGDFLLECVYDVNTNENKWEGHVPTCVRPGGTTYYVVPVLFLPISLIIAVVCAAVRQSRRPADARSSKVVVQTSSTPSRGRSLKTGGPPGYKRFDDSNINVPRNGGTPSIV